MLGHFTERATSRGHSRSFSNHGHTTISRNDSDQRRALLLPQEFKELGSERLVVIVENCKPILGQKIRYHRDEVFRARLRRPPAVPCIDMDLHFARVQQRWRYAEDELAPGEDLRVEQLAQNFDGLPDLGDEPSTAVVDSFVTAFFERTKKGYLRTADGSTEPIGNDGAANDVPHGLVQPTETGPVVTDQ